MGHVFVVPGDIRRLACDGWMVPTDKIFVLSGVWKDDLRLVSSMADARRKHGPMAADERVVQWPIDGGADLWMVDVGLFDDDMHRVHEGVREFLRKAGEALAGSSPRFGRARPLIALPVVGSGMAAADPKKRAIALESLLLILRDETPEHLDVALVTHTDWGMFSAAQKQRTKLAMGWPDLDGGLEDSLRRVAEIAQGGDLVLFVGAGASAGAGLPIWKKLLGDLAEEIELSATARQELGDLSLLDQAEVIAGRLRADERVLGDVVAGYFSASDYSLTHALLASLPVQEIVTTNYDTLLELAAESVGRPLRVLPDEPLGSVSRWLLKLHGTVTKPESIVLTREDYLRYSDQRQALAGIVHALLITKHMLFVGFGLDDDNFHRIVDDVRKAMRPPGSTTSEPFGTAMLPSATDLQRELWMKDLSCINIEPINTPEAFRKQEIALDYLLAKSSFSTGHLLDPDFEELLDPDDRDLRELLQEVAAKVSNGEHRSPAWEGLTRLLRTLGLRD